MQDRPALGGRHRVFGFGHRVSIAGPAGFSPLPEPEAGDGPGHGGAHLVAVGSEAFALEDADAPARPSDEDERRLLEQYLDAFAEYDIDRIVALLRYDVVFDMPPLPLWVRGPEQVGRFMLGPGAACRDSKLIALAANGCPAFASYKPDPESGTWLPWSLTILELAAKNGGAPTVTGVHNFLQPFLPPLFSAFGLPERRTDADPVVALSP